MSGAPKSWSSVASSLSQTIVSHTLPKLKDAFGKIDDTLFDMSQSGVSNSSDHIDALRVVRNSRQSLLQSWPEHVQKQVVGWGQPKNTSNVLELSLVGHDELEEKLAVDQMADTFYKHNNLLFNALDPVWAAFPNTSDDAAPLGPKGFAGMLCLWLAALDLNAEDRVVVLKIMEREIGPIIAPLLTEAIDMFKRWGFEVGNVQPVIKAERARSSQPSQHTSSKQDDDRGGWDSDQVAPHTPQMLGDMRAAHHRPQLGHGPSSHGSGYRPSAFTSPAISGQAAHDLAVMFQQLMNGQSFAGWNGDEYGEYAGADLVHAHQGHGHQSMGFDSARYAASQAYPVQGNVINDLDDQDIDPILSDLVGLIQQRRTSHRTNRTLRDKPVIGAEILRDVLNDMQKELPQSVKQAARQNDQTLAQQFKDEMLQKAVRIGHAPKDSKLNDQDEDAVDIVGMLFEIFLTERRISDEMREHIARLLAPYVKVAINDRKMFMHKSHPARKFLDVLAEACEGNSGISNHEKTTLAKVTHSIDQLSREFNEDVAIFELAESEIRQFIAQQRAGIELAERRAAEALRGKERLENSKKTALDVFNQYTAECNWPIKTVDLIRNYWCQHHMLLLLKQENHNETSEAISQSIELLERMVKVGTEGAATCKDIAAALHQQMVQMLSSSGVIDETAHNVATEIWSALDQASVWIHMVKNGIQPAQEPQVPAIQHPTVFAQPVVPEEPASSLKPEEIAEVEKLDAQQSEPEVLNDEIPETPKRILSSTQELVDYFKNLEIGTWVDFVKPDGVLISTKFSWVSPISQRLLFVTQRGTKHAVESAEDLAMMVRLDRVRLRDVGLGEHGFAHSYQRAIHQLQQQAQPDETPSASAKSNGAHDVANA